ncbi:MAG: hypothetical protein HQL74_15150 [Magnetococcales bacterium]|nr:hypothetical protein [Magnetococcales bacterium]
MTDTNAPNGEILLYQTEDGHTRLQVLMTGETLWLSQARMAELFQTTKAHAETEFEKFRVLRHESDFDRMVKQLPKSGKNHEIPF